MVNVELKRLTTKQLWARFNTLLSDLASNVRQIADYFCELKDRGEDLSAFSAQMFLALPDVANGTLLPELLVKYGSTSVLKDIRVLVKEDQEKLAKPDATVQVVTVSGKIENKDPMSLSAKEAKQVFGDGVIRSPKEQVKHAPQSPPSGHVTKDNINDIRQYLTPREEAYVRREAIEREMPAAEYIVTTMRDNGLLGVDPPSKRVPVRAHTREARPSS